MTEQEARNDERELIANYVEGRAKQLGEKADLQEFDDDVIELKSKAWTFLVLAAEIRKIGKS